MITEIKVKGKVLPYLLPSVGPGADPGVQSVSPQSFTPAVGCFPTGLLVALSLLYDYIHLVNVSFLCIVYRTPCPRSKFRIHLVVSSCFKETAMGCQYYDSAYMQHTATKSVDTG